MIIKEICGKLSTVYCMNLLVLGCCLFPSLIVEAVRDDCSLAHTLTDTHTDVLGHHLAKKPTKVGHEIIGQN